jgi:cysteinyl-tRNA synthetase
MIRTLVGMTLGVGITWQVAFAQPFDPATMAYVLQADKLAKPKAAAVARLAACGRDLVVIDYSYDGGTDGKWTHGEIDAIRRGKPGRKVIAYLSIGEAEDYRPYWRKAWDANRDGRPDSGAPAFLCPVNPDWQGNYKVRYWDPTWQKIILAYLDEIVAQGFDGVYLDIVDGFEFFEYDAKKDDWIDNRPNPSTGNTYREDTVAWVLRLAARARAKAGKGFLVIPQNAAQLLEHPKYLAEINAIGVEDLFTDGNRKQGKDDTRYVLDFLKHAKRAGKPVFVIEYGKKEAARNISRQGARAGGFRLLLTDRNLTGGDLASPK